MLKGTFGKILSEIPRETPDEKPLKKRLGENDPDIIQGTGIASEKNEKTKKNTWKNSWRNPRRVP